MINELISVIVPVYNAEKYIQKCLENIINQTYSNIEILLIDDGSLDKSGILCDEYAQKYINVESYHKDNGGASAARNFGLQKAKGEWILFVDVDDYIDNNYIVELVQPTKTDELNMVICGYEINYIDDNYTRYCYIDLKNKTFFKEQVKNAIYELDAIGLLNVVYCKLYNRKIIMSNKIIFDIMLKTGQDLAFNCSYFRYVSKIKILDICPYHYIKRNTISLVNSYKRNMLEIVSKCNEERLNLYKFYSMNTDKYMCVYGKRYIGYIFSCIPNIYNYSKDIKFLDRKKQIDIIMNDNKLKHYSKLCYKELDILTKIFIILYRTKNVYIFDFAYLILFFIKHHFFYIYRHIRKILFNGVIKFNK